MLHAIIALAAAAAAAAVHNVCLLRAIAISVVHNLTQFQGAARAEIDSVRDGYVFM
jgi:hypothetical protein